ncbi:MAG: tetratricopeptide repeat protein [Chloroflexaceae bacterium]|nr:tetratricopeptide repeat protein [Chloroflexaceae bacterium]
MGIIRKTVTREFTGMMKSALEQRILRTRLEPPPQQTRLLTRQRVLTQLTGIVEYPLSIIIGPAGSGKTTALANLQNHTATPIIWCRAAADDTPASFVHHLAAACQRILHGQPEPEPHERERNGLQLSHSPQVALDQIVNALVTELAEPVILVLDDYHLIDRTPDMRSLIERLLRLQPRYLHIVLATRRSPTLDHLPIARARGEVLELDADDLAFTVAETLALFELYDHTLVREGQPLPVLTELTSYCRGLALALQLAAADNLRDPLGNGIPLTARTELCADLTFDYPPAALRPLIERQLPLIDAYIAREVLADLPDALHDLLKASAGLRWIDPQLCAQELGVPDAAALLDRARRDLLFMEPVAEAPERLAWQPLFHHVLRRYTASQHYDLDPIHQRAADYYTTHTEYSEALYHLCALGKIEEAANLLESIVSLWLQQGQSGRIMTWINRLPEAYRQRPRLLEAQAGAAHKQGRFEQALALYQQAATTYETQGDTDGQVRVLRGQAEVYLDTVQPAPAVELLKRALELLPGDHYVERVQILLLQAENWANLGRADVALELETRAREVVQEASARGVISEALPTASLVPLLLPRLMLRSGQLQESLQQLEADLEHATEFEQPTYVLAHREPSLLLAFVYCLLGKDARALATARRGLLEAQQSGSQLTEAIAHIRVGHAYQVVTPLDEHAARRHYQQALEIIDAIGIERTRVEALMGLVLLHGHNGDLATAEMLAYQALEIAERAGDEWISALVWLALGSSAVANRDARAPAWLEQAQQRFLRGQDNYGQALVALWLVLWYLQHDSEGQGESHVQRVLDLARQHSYEGLLTAPTLFGPRDLAMLIPLLLRGKHLPEHTTYVQQLLRAAFPSIAADDVVEEYHPGFTLRVQMLGSFRVWRGIHEIQTREWQREKARQLLQLLLTYRGQWLQREQICMWLWPDSDLESAERQFKVTLNALNTALEPLRPPRTMPFFVRRQGLAYSFAPSYGCWIDVDEFELRTTRIAQGDAAFMLRNRMISVGLYRGDYLAEALYDSWTLEERERLLARYLNTTTALAGALVERGDVQQAIELCEQVLRRDRCYEEAYQVLMLAYIRTGSRSQALRTYTRCVQALEGELGIEPLPETTELYERIKLNQKL